MAYTANMANKEPAASHFRRTVRQERERRGWSQKELAQRLTERGVPIDASAIAKIESNKRARVVRLDEAAALADLFGLSIDTLIGRRTGFGDDLLFALRGLLEVARQSTQQLQITAADLQARFRDLAPYEFGGRKDLVFLGNEAGDALDKAIWKLMQLANFELPDNTDVRLRDDLVERAVVEKLEQLMREKGWRTDEAQS